MICSSGIGFDPKIGRLELEFGFHGIWQGTAVLYDKQTKSHWLHLTGECIAGRLKGKQLTSIPGRHVQWWEWKRDHPKTLVMAEDKRFKPRYFDRASSDRGNSFLPGGFRATIENLDERLPPSTLCYGVKTAGGARAYPIKALRNLKRDVINDVVGRTPVVIILDPATGSATGYKRVLIGATLTFERTKDGLLRARESRTVFNRDGLAIEGKLKGRRLPRIHALQTEWYGWYAAYPATSIYAVSDSE